VCDSLKLQRLILETVVGPSVEDAGGGQGAPGAGRGGSGARRRGLWRWAGKDRGFTPRSVKRADGDSTLAVRWALRPAGPVRTGIQGGIPGSEPCRYPRTGGPPAKTTAGRGVRVPTARPIPAPLYLPLPLVWEESQKIGDSTLQVLGTGDVDSVSHDGAEETHLSSSSSAKATTLLLPPLP
jgi:hypothetical protein